MREKQVIQSVSKRRRHSIKFKYWSILNLLFTYLYTHCGFKERIFEVVKMVNTFQITPLHVCFAIIKLYYVPCSLNSLWVVPLCPSFMGKYFNITKSIDDLKQIDRWLFLQKKKKNEFIRYQQLQFIRYQNCNSESTTMVSHMLSPCTAKEEALFNREEKEVGRATVNKESVAFHWLSPWC